MFGCCNRSFGGGDDHHDRLLHALVVHVQVVQVATGELVIYEHRDCQLYSCRWISSSIQRFRLSHLSRHVASFGQFHIQLINE